MYGSTYYLAELTEGGPNEEEGVHRQEDIEIGEDKEFSGKSNALQFQVVVGVLMGLQEDLTPLVDFPEKQTDMPVSARSTIGLTTEDVGSEVVLAFDRGDTRRPIILGCLNREKVIEKPKAEPIVKEGTQLVFAAKDEIVLNCGKASITLTRAGKIVIRGEYVVSHAAGVNRIRGGSVQIN